MICTQCGLEMGDHPHNGIADCGDAWQDHTARNLPRTNREQFKWLHEPKYRMGQTVWVMKARKGEAHVWQDRVVRLWAELFQEDLRHRFPQDSPDQAYGVLRGYVLGCYNMDDPNSLWHECDIYPTEASAMWNAQFTKVTLSDEEWRKAIGPEDRDYDEDEEEDMELQRCCAQISTIRDMLFECKRLGGLTVAATKRLQQALHHHETITTETPILNKIFTALGVKWEPGNDEG